MVFADGAPVGFDEEGAFGVVVEDGEGDAVEVFFAVAAAEAVAVADHAVGGGPGAVVEVFDEDGGLGVEVVGADDFRGDGFSGGHDGRAVVLGAFGDEREMAVIVGGEDAEVADAGWAEAAAVGVAEDFEDREGQSAAAG